MHVTPYFGIQSFPVVVTRLNFEIAMNAFDSLEQFAAWLVD
jgi:hypothetical protein